MVLLQSQLSLWKDTVGSNETWYSTNSHTKYKEAIYAWESESFSYNNNGAICFIMEIVYQQSSATPCYKSVTSYNDTEILWLFIWKDKHFPESWSVTSDVNNEVSLLCQNQGLVVL